MDDVCLVRECSGEMVLMKDVREFGLTELRRRREETALPSMILTYHGDE